MSNIKNIIPKNIFEESLKQHWIVITIKNNLGVIAPGTKIQVECKNCHYIWDTKYRHAVKSTCPKCAGDDKISKNIKGLIYKVTCTETHKVYIGQTIQKLIDRYKGHFRHSKDPSHPAYHGHFARALRAHGPECFTWEVVHSDVPWDKLDELEILEITKHDSYNNGYNCTEGGNMGNRTAVLAKERFEKYIKKERETEIKLRAQQQKRSLTNFEKNLKSELSKYKKELTLNKDDELKKLKENRNRVLGAKTQKEKQIVEGKSSRYIGVCCDTGNKKWRAAIKHNGKKIYIGLFATEETAARAYDQMCIQLRGNKAQLNFQPSTFVSSSLNI
jgi:group I intron endonuclease